MNPQLGAALQNPQIRSMLSNPNILRQMADPAVLQVGILCCTYTYYANIPLSLLVHFDSLPLIPPFQPLPLALPPLLPLSLALLSLLPHQSAMHMQALQQQMGQAGGLGAPNLLGQAPGQGMGMGMGGAVPPSPWGAAPGVGGNQALPGGLDFSRLFAPGKYYTLDAPPTYHIV